MQKGTHRLQKGTHRLQKNKYPGGFDKPVDTHKQTVDVDVVRDLFVIWIRFSPSAYPDREHPAAVIETGFLGRISADCGSQ
jgi:hypothetical protein